MGFFKKTFGSIFRGVGDVLSSTPFVGSSFFSGNIGFVNAPWKMSHKIVSGLQHTTKTREITRKGFLKKDVEMFLQRGDTQAGGLSAERQNRFNTIDKFKPKVKVDKIRETVKETNKLGDLYGAKNEKTSETVQQSSSIDNPFFNISQKEVDRITSLFLQRQNYLNLRRQRPGRTGATTSRNLTVSSAGLQAIS